MVSYLKIQPVIGFENIYQVDSFEKEFEKTLSEKNVNGRYHRWLRIHLAHLEQLGLKALELGNFEPLNGTNPNLYAIRYPHSKKNPRVVYIYADDNQVYLLHVFKESRRSDYDNAIKLAQNRAKLLLE